MAQTLHCVDSLKTRLVSCRFWLKLLYPQVSYIREKELPKMNPVNMLAISLFTPQVYPPLGYWYHTIVIWTADKALVSSLTFFILGNPKLHSTLGSNPQVCAATNQSISWMLPWLYVVQTPRKEKTVFSSYYCKGLAHKSILWNVTLPPTRIIQKRNYHQ